MITSIEFVECWSKKRFVVYSLDSAVVEISPVFYESKTYDIEILVDKDAYELELKIDDEELLALRSSESGLFRWRWDVGFFAGAVDLEVLEHSNVVFEKRLILSPALNKLTYSDFEIMLTQILDESSDLFALGSSKVSISDGDEYQTPITKLEYLRSKIDEITTVVQAIIDNPVCSLKRVINYYDVDRSPYPMAPEYYSEACAQFGVIVSKGRILPRKSPVSTVVSEYDLFEHKCIKQSLKSWSSWLRSIAHKISKNNGSDPSGKWHRRCLALSLRIQSLLECDFFRDISSDESIWIEPTEVFISNPLYRKFFDLQRRVNQGVGDVLGDYLDVSIAKTYQLYELWSYYRLIKAVKCLGYEVNEFKVVRKSGVGSSYETLIKVSFDGFELHFQKSYREYWKGDSGTGSFTRTMIPDISLVSTSADNSDVGIIVFDAKYRVEKSLNEAIASIHMYRDAIVNCDADDDVVRTVSGAYLLSPSTYDGMSGSWKNMASPKVFFHPAYIEKFKFGILSLNPKADIDELSGVLKQIIDGIGS